MSDTAIKQVPQTRAKTNGAPPPAPAPRSEPDQWEYMSLGGGEQHRLNTLGEAGWEAYAAPVVPGRGLCFYLKRRKV